MGLVHTSFSSWLGQLRMWPVPRSAPSPRGMLSARKIPVSSPSAISTLSRRHVTLHSPWHHHLVTQALLKVNPSSRCKYICSYKSISNEKYHIEELNEKNNFLNSINIIFWIICISMVKSYLEKPFIF